MYTIEMAYARMRELQDQANRSRAHQSAVEARTAEKKRAAHAKKR
ncbi:hypothetical protein [Streptomyces sp. NPDC048641]